MKKYNYILFFLITLNVFSQNEAIKNYGNIQMHENANVGFHTNLINDGKFDENKGFTGFYHNNNKLTVSGTNKAIFNNVEIGVLNNIVLETSLGVTNDFAFLEGKIETPRNNPKVSLEFINYNLHFGESNNRYVDGYTSIINNGSFEFPIGDDNRLRTMILPSNSNNFKGAYFFENPNNPSTFNSLNTESKQFDLGAINTQEFWDLNGKDSTSITLTWDELSNITLMSQKLEDLRVVGWNKNNNRWEDLGNTKVSGSLEKGKITSIEFIPDTYEALTIGTVKTEEVALCNGNYVISTNNDGVNDHLKMLCLKDYPKNNELSVYNRWGNLVYRALNYDQNWDGKSEGRSTILKNEGLPTGTYFYMFKYGTNKNLDKLQKGWVYINN